MTTVGTSYFVSFTTAVKYYRDYHYDAVIETVQRKLEAGEIHIGKPELKSGQTLSVIDNGTRYAVTDK